jgi:hypothetical protein
LEGDAKGVIDAVNCELADRSLLGLVIEDIKVGGAAGVGPVADDICKKRWEQPNKAAHLLSKYAVRHAVDKFWQEPPDCIREILLLEQIALAA